MKRILKHKLIYPKDSSRPSHNLGAIHRQFACLGRFEIESFDMHSVSSY